MRSSGPSEIIGVRPGAGSLWIALSTLRDALTPVPALLTELSKLLLRVRSMENIVGDDDQFGFVENLN